MYTPKERVILTMSNTIGRHRPGPRGEGEVGQTCASPLCDGIIFLTIKDGYNHQANRIFYAIEDELEEQRLAALEEAEDQLEGLQPVLETITQEAS